MEELANNCTWTWTTIGYKVTGGNGKSIFLPACGIHIASSFEYGGNRGLYWSSSYDVDDNEVARYLKFNHSIVWKGCLLNYVALVVLSVRFQNKTQRIQFIQLSPKHD